MQPTWKGVMPALTTPFTESMELDVPFIEKHCRWFIEHGATALVPGGSLGEGTTLSFEEKVQLFEACVRAGGDRVPVVPGIASLSTGEAVALAQSAERVGCGGLMVLPPYVYQGDWRETRAHFEAVIQATALPCMLYNNPIAYGTDVTPEQMAQMAEAHPNLKAVKESSGNIRRITAIHALLGDRLSISVGLDDIVVEGVQAGAVGWVAGLVNALPLESQQLFDFALEGKTKEAQAMYAWFLPLLRLDTDPKFVQYIKLVQQELDWGHERVRTPRRVLIGEERDRVLSIIRSSLKARTVLS